MSESSALSAFMPQVQRWFRERLGEPTPPQQRGWGPIRAGRNVLIAAPTGSGKTLAAFLAGIDALLHEGPALPAETRILYISPLKALGNDVRKNLELPLAQLRELDPELPALTARVRSGDTPSSERAKMVRKPPHILVTTPESLYILLTTQGGQKILRTVRSVIVDEIHSLVDNKRGAHLALSLERLEALTERPLQRVGLSATQKPMDEIAQFLVGAGRTCEVIDTGHRRELDVSIELPDQPLTAVCTRDHWEEIFGRVQGLIEAHRTTIVFVNTRRLAERISARLQELLGPEQVTAHHGSLSKDLRLDAETRLKSGKLRALVATASLELGIDIGDVDLVVQIGSTRSIATFLQRVGRAGHGVGRIPKGRLVPLTRDELVEAVSLLRAVRRGELDLLQIPPGPLDILAQQIVASCVTETWDRRSLYEVLKRAYPYRDLEEQRFDETFKLHCEGRGALLHYDGVQERILATKRARLTAITAGGAIPELGLFKVVEAPEDTYVGSLDEEFAVESSPGDIFQLGTTSWLILRVEQRSGTVRVVNAEGAPPTLPVWQGEAPARTAELSYEVGNLRETWDASAVEPGLPAHGALQISEYLEAGRRALGTVPTQHRLILERFFDETGGQQLILHSPYGGRINRAFGLALRKRFCKGFGFELQAAATEEAILISLGPHHSFPLEDVFSFLNSNSARNVLTQALLGVPLFGTRWRWNVTRSLQIPRFQGGKKVPAPLLRMKAEDALVKAFPSVQACPETLPAGALEVPEGHPLVDQTIADCLHEAMDIEGFLSLLRALESGEVEKVARDTPEPSIFAEEILHASPYAFLDDAPAEERRVQAVRSRRGSSAHQQDTLGALDPLAIARVREEAWPQPVSAEEVHEALCWMGYVTGAEAPGWVGWLEALEAAGRVERDGQGRWFAVEASRDPVEVWRGRCEVLGPFVSDDPVLFQLETEGLCLRTRIDGQEVWCHRRLLERIQRYTLDTLRREIEPVSVGVFWRFLARWQRAAPGHRREGPKGVLEVVRQLAGFEAPAREWERSILPARVDAYRRELLDELTLSGQVVWGRLWGEGGGPIKTQPICLLPRDDLDLWFELSGPASEDELRGNARSILEALDQRGAQFALDLRRRARLLPEHLEEGLAELVGRGVVTCDSYAGLRSLIVPPSKRQYGLSSAGRWSRFREDLPPIERGPGDPSLAEQVARVLLQRTGVVFKRLLARERLPLPWWEILQALRRFELRGDVRGGRFVAGIPGEQYALPEAVTALRRLRREGDAAPLEVAASDPLNLQGILTDEDRVARSLKRTVAVGA